MSSSQNSSLKHAIASILVPKRGRWVCCEALFSLVTPGHLLSPHLFLICMLNRLLRINVLIYRKYGLIHFILNSDRFLVYVPLLNTLVLHLRTLLSLPFITTHIQLTTISRYLSISYGTHIHNFI